MFGTKTLAAISGQSSRVSARPALAAGLSLILAYPLIGSCLAPFGLTVDPNHEHLTLGGTPAAIPLVLRSHPHSLREAHSHPITGGVLDSLPDRNPQVLSYGGGLFAVGTATFAGAAAGLLPATTMVPALPLALLLPLAIAAAALARSPGLPPPLPPPE
jgi:hypothetical protein